MLALKNRVRTTPPLARVVQHPSRGAHLSQPPRLHTRPHMTKERMSTVLDSMCLRHKSNPHSLQILPPSRRPPLQPSCAPLHGSPSSLPRIKRSNPCVPPLCVARWCRLASAADSQACSNGLAPLASATDPNQARRGQAANCVAVSMLSARCPWTRCPRAVRTLSARCPHAIRTLWW